MPDKQKPSVCVINYKYKRICLKLLIFPAWDYVHPQGMNYLNHTILSVTIQIKSDSIIWKKQKTCWSAHTDSQLLPSLGATFQCVYVLVFHQLCHKHFCDTDIKCRQSNVNGTRYTQVTSCRSLDNCFHVHVVDNANSHRVGMFLYQTVSFTVHKSSALYQSRRRHRNHYNINH